MPAGAEVLPFRSNVPALSDFSFVRNDPTFPARARKAGSGFIVGGENYGQGSSREHAALVPMYLGIQAVIVKSFARIHQANLVNVGILPMVFTDASQYALVQQGDVLRIEGIRAALRSGQPLVIVNVTRQCDVAVRYDLSPRQVEVLLAGGLLNYIKANA
jgi:aconitate hydratase